MTIHPNPVQYDLCGSDLHWPLGCGMFIAMEFSRSAGARPGLTIDPRPPLSQFAEVIGQWSEKDAYAGQFKCRLRRINRSELPAYALGPMESTRKRPMGAPSAQGVVGVVAAAGSQPAARAAA